MLRIISFIQGTYYATTGIWAIFHMKSFMVVTGPKTDLWLVKLIGGLTVSISVVIFITGIRNRIHWESLLVILISSLSYLLTDIINASYGIISKIYLCDALLQVIFIVTWIMLAIKMKPK